MQPQESTTTYEPTLFLNQFRTLASQLVPPKQDSKLKLTCSEEQTQFVDTILEEEQREFEAFQGELEQDLSEKRLLLIQRNVNSLSEPDLN